MTGFPRLTEARRREMLTLPEGPLRVLIDTDTANEIDDQFALAWALLSPERLDVEAVVAEPYSFAHFRQPLLDAAAALAADPENRADGFFGDWARRLAAAGMDPADIYFDTAAEGMEKSFDEIENVFAKMGIASTGLAFRGSDRYMGGPHTPVASEGAERIIEAALADDERVLHVVAIGAVSNIASALLMEPEIATRMVVNWTSGYPTWTGLSNQPSLNLVQDPHASRLLFESHVPMVYLPGYHVGAQLRVSLPDMEAWVKGQGAIGDYLHHLYTHNPIHTQRTIASFPGQSWVMWDLINIAWLLDPRWVPTRFVATPTLDAELFWQPQLAAPQMLEAYDIDCDAVFGDFMSKLHDQDEILATTRSGKA